MNKSVPLLLGATAVLALGGAAPAATPTAYVSGHAAKRFYTASPGSGFLYDQNDNDYMGIAIVSQNFETSYDIYDSQGADDFTVPKGATWKVNEIDVTGQYFNGSGPARSENVFFYKNKGGRPGAIVKECDNLAGMDVVGSFMIKLKKSCAPKLKAGHYWVSVQINLDFAVGGEWGWEQRAIVNGIAAMWQNPGDGFATGCTTWADEFTCLGVLPGHRPPDGGVDHMFTLKGKTN